MSNTKVRSADEQCQEYVLKVREMQRRKQADASLDAHLRMMQRQFGVTLTMGSLFRLVGLLVSDQHPNFMIRHCRGFLARCIAKGIGRRLLTRARILH
jgi:hypothetical protein